VPYLKSCKDYDPRPKHGGAPSFAQTQEPLNILKGIELSTETLAETLENEFANQCELLFCLNAQIGEKLIDRLKTVDSSSLK
jgi:hypothetical protein